MELLLDLFSGKIYTFEEQFGMFMQATCALHRQYILPKVVIESLPETYSIFIF